MIHPGYLLNPGDMFQVEPERVLFATGARKDQFGYYRRHPERTPEALEQQTGPQRGSGAARGRATDEEKAEIKRLRAERRKEERRAHVQGTKVERERRQKDFTEGLASAQKAAGPKELLRFLYARAQSVLVDYKDEFRYNLQLDLARFRKTVDVTLARLSRGEKNPALSDGSMEVKVEDIIAKMALLSRPRAYPPPSAFKRSTNTDTSATESSVTSPNSTSSDTNSPAIDTATDASQAENENEGLPMMETKSLIEALRRINANPPDFSKPYVTPWRPRDFMAPFAFIPRYLEVNQNICAAVYLRHPVARPGLAEVPTPFHLETSELAFTWYLRRR